MKEIQGMFLAKAVESGLFNRPPEPAGSEEVRLIR